MIPHSRPSIDPEETAAAERVLRSGMLAQGVEVAAFERECAAACGRRHGVAVSSGTAALHLALGACGVEDGQAVAVPSYACAALITAVQLQRAQPVLCDIDDDFNLDPDAVPRDCPAAIVPHLFGATARMPEAGVVIEDIAQSMGGETGRATRVAITSFYATKLMTTGEGGMVLTDDADIAEYARDHRDYDNRDDFKARCPYRMTDFQAAIGRVQLKRLPNFIERRRAIALRYDAAFANAPWRRPRTEDHVFFRYVIETDRRDELEAHLRAAGVDAKRPVYRPAHHYLGGRFPRSQAAHDRCLSLPIFPSMVDDEVEHVVNSSLAFS